MAFTSGFFNSQKGDRRYNAEQMSEIFDGILKDGIIPSQGQLFAVLSANNGMQITVGTGRAWFNHTWSKNDSIMILTVADSDITRSRYDAVVLEVNHAISVRSNSIKLVQGNPDTNPIRPSLVNTDEIKQYPLAYIHVKAGVSEIKAEDIESMIGRFPTVFATGVLESVSIDSLWAQWKGDWETWFSGIKLQLSNDVVTNLQYQIEGKVNISDKATTAEAKVGTNNTKWMTPLRVKESLDDYHANNSSKITGSNGKFTLTSNPYVIPWSYLEYRTAATGGNSVNNPTHSLDFPTFSVLYVFSTGTYKTATACYISENVIGRAVTAPAGLCGHILKAPNNNTNFYGVIFSNNTIRLYRYTPTKSNPFASGVQINSIASTFDPRDTLIDSNNVYTIHYAENAMYISVIPLNGGTAVTYTNTSYNRNVSIPYSVVYNNNIVILSSTPKDTGSPFTSRGIWRCTFSLSTFKFSSWSKILTIGNLASIIGNYGAIGTNWFLSNDKIYCYIYVGLNSYLSFIGVYNLSTNTIETVVLNDSDTVEAPTYGFINLNDGRIMFKSIKGSRGTVGTYIANGASISTYSNPIVEAEITGEFLSNICFQNNMFGPIGGNNIIRTFPILVSFDGTIYVMDTPPTNGLGGSSNNTVQSSGYICTNNLGIVGLAASYINSALELTYNTKKRATIAMMD